MQGGCFSGCGTTFAVLAIALAELGLTETARNTGTEVGGVAIEGDIGLEDDKFAVHVTLFGNGEQAHHAELGLRANPSTRSATSRGLSAVKTVGRVVYVANGRGSVMDEFRVDEVVHTVGGIALPSPLNIADDAPNRTKATSGTRPSTPSFAQVSRPSPDTLEQLRKLGELRATGVLSNAEFEAKKAELLRRI
jgi:Short C-terminal domain